MQSFPLLDEPEIETLWSTEEYQLPVGKRRAVHVPCAPLPEIPKESEHIILPATATMIPTSLIEEQLVVLSRLKTLHGYARGNEDGHALHTYTSGSAPRYTPPASHMTAHHAQRWMQTSVVMLALHAGFDGIQIQPLEVLSQVAEEFIVQLAKKMMQHHTTSCSLWRTSYETKQNELPPLIEHVREYKIPRTIATNKMKGVVTRWQWAAIEAFHQHGLDFTDLIQFVTRIVRFGDHLALMERKVLKKAKAPKSGKGIDPASIHRDCRGLSPGMSFLFPQFRACGEDAHLPKPKAVPKKSTPTASSTTCSTAPAHSNVPLSSAFSDFEIEELAGEGLTLKIEQLDRALAKSAAAQSNGTNQNDDLPLDGAELDLTHLDDLFAGEPMLPDDDDLLPM